jgi:hypothetical protein
MIASEIVRMHPPVVAGRIDLATLGTSRGFTVRHLREGSQATYQLAYLLADYLITRDGVERVVDYFHFLARRVERRASFVAAFGQSIDEFEQEALAHLAKFTQ